MRLQYYSRLFSFGTDRELSCSFVEDSIFLWTFPTRFLCLSSASVLMWADNTEHWSFNSMGSDICKTRSKEIGRQFRHRTCGQITSKIRLVTYCGIQTTLQSLNGRPYEFSRFHFLINKGLIITIFSMELHDYVIQWALLYLPHLNKVCFGWRAGNNRLTGRHFGTFGSILIKDQTRVSGLWWWG